MKRARRGDVVEVEWDDSESLSLNGWAPTEAFMEAARMPPSYRTAGYFMGRTGRKIVVAMSLSPANRKISDCIAIPRAVVTKTTVLGRASKRVRRALRP